MEEEKKPLDKPVVRIEPMELDKLFKELITRAQELDEMDLDFADHPKIRNLMNEHFPNFTATPQEDMPDGEEWNKIYFRGILVVSGKKQSQVSELEWQKRSLLITFWYDHSVEAVPINDEKREYFNFPEWEEDTYAQFFRVLEIYLKKQKCFRKKKLVA